MRHDVSTIYNQHMNQFMKLTINKAEFGNAHFRAIAQKFYIQVIPLNKKNNVYIFLTSSYFIVLLPSSNLIY